MKKELQVLHDQIWQTRELKQDYKMVLNLCKKYKRLLKKEDDNTYDNEWWYVNWYMALSSDKLGRQDDALKYIDECFKYIDVIDDDKKINTLQLKAWINEGINSELAIDCYNNCLESITNMLPYDDESNNIKNLYGVTIHNLAKLTSNETLMRKALVIFKEINNIEYWNESNRQLLQMRESHKQSA